MSRLPAPKNLNKPWFKAGKLMSEFDEEGIIATMWHVFIAALVTAIFTINVSLFFLFFLTTPVLQLSIMLRYALGTHEFSGGGYDYYTNKTYSGSLYSEGVQVFRQFYQEDVKKEALKLLNNIYQHETALLDADKPHRQNNCKTCAKRLKLMEELAQSQVEPGTNTMDIDHVESLLEGKRMVKELM